VRPRGFGVGRARRPTEVGSANRRKGTLVTAALPLWADALVAALLIVGAAFALVGSWGLAKLGDFYKRLHGPTKATTLGVGGVLIASAVYFSVRDGSLSLHELLITMFVFLTAPISAHLLVKAALHLARRDDGPRSVEPSSKSRRAARKREGPQRAPR
jgi:multicomponent K+:H+ antiporter subunit G